MKLLLCLLLISCLVIESLAIASLEKIDVKIIDPSKGKCTIKINPGPPKTVDIDIEALIDAKDITLKFGAFSLMDGNYNEFIESDSVSICDMPKSDNPLVVFVYKEMAKAGNVATNCPWNKGHFYLHGFGIDDKDIPNDVPIPTGSFKIELNGTLHEHDKDTPLFVCDIFFKEM